MQILVLCDDYWHPARTARTGLAPLADADCSFDWLEDASAWSAEQMAAYPLVILTKANNMSARDQTPWASDAVQRAFVKYVGDGGGLLVIHSGTAGYQDLPELRSLMGGAFTHHPPQCLVTVQPHAGHPLAVDSAPFTLQDEHYMMDGDEHEKDVFLTTTSPHGTQPGGWTRTQGSGRVCVLTPGHNLEVWLHPSYQTLLRKAIRWCGARP